MLPLPINLEELLHGRIVESDRLVFQKKWNAESTLHTICAFANDINNEGGGYLIIGAEEKNGSPIFPPTGLSTSAVEEINKELAYLCDKLRPIYQPIVASGIFQEKTILIIWCPGGQTRPYQAPEALNKKPVYFYFIRKNSTTAKAQTKDLPKLYELANQVPFDDRICHKADLADIDLFLVQGFLARIKSDLVSQIPKVSFTDICRQMHIVHGPEEYLKPLNSGLLMFNPNPERFFPMAQIEIVEFYELGDAFSEKIFKGPLHLQVKEALTYLNTMLIKEEVRKRPGRAEADRFYNYPYEALEESLVNAVYHKSYEQREPIEVRIQSDCIQILSYPGPLPPIKIDDLNQGSVLARTYRNRRIGDFFKELQLTEGRGTGIPKIHRAMKRNGSPPPIFETDADNNYFLTTLPIHPELIKERLQSSMDTHDSDKSQLETDTHQLQTKKSTSATHQLQAKKNTPGTHQLQAKKSTSGTHQFQAKKSAPGTHQLQNKKSTSGTHQLQAKKSAPGTHQLQAKKSTPGTHQLQMKKLSPVERNNRIVRK